MKRNITCTLEINENFHQLEAKKAKIEELSADTIAYTSIIEAEEINAETLTLENISTNRVLYVNDQDPREVTAAPALGSTQVLGGSSSGPPEAKTVSGVQDEIQVAHTSGSITIGIDSAYKTGILQSIKGTTDQIDIATTTDDITIGISSNYTLDHGNLQGLDDDDHPQYLKADGTRKLTGNLNPDTSGISLGATTAFDEITGETIKTDTVSPLNNGYVDVVGTRFQMVDYWPYHGELAVIRNPFRYFHCEFFNVSNVTAGSTVFGSLGANGYPMMFIPHLKGYVEGYDIIIDDEYTSWTTDNATDNTLTVTVKQGTNTIFTSGPHNKNDFESYGIGSKGKAMVNFLVDMPTFQSGEEITCEFTAGSQWDGTALEISVMLHLYFDNTV